MPRQYTVDTNRRHLGYGQPQQHPVSVVYSAIDEDTVDDEGKHPYASVELMMSRELTNDADNAALSGQLLRHRQAEIAGAYAHTSMGGAIPTLLGMATNRYRRAMVDPTGMPSHGRSLSTDSAALVQNLRSSGVEIPLNQYNPEAHKTNSIAAEGRDQYTTPPISKFDESRIGDSTHPEVRAGAATTRSILRGARGPRTPPINPTQFQGEQLRLF